MSQTQPLESETKTTWVAPSQRCLVLKVFKGKILATGMAGASVHSIPAAQSFRDLQHLTQDCRRIYLKPNPEDRHATQLLAKHQVIICLSLKEERRDGFNWIEVGQLSNSARGVDRSKEDLFSFLSRIVQVLPDVITPAAESLANPELRLDLFAAKDAIEFCGSECSLPPI